LKEVGGEGDAQAGPVGEGVPYGQVVGAGEGGERMALRLA
jgi:hypothetical protein